MNITIKKIINIVLIAIAFNAELLQEGVYPECSYVEVTFDGWRMHKNYEGRILSMQAPGSHNTKLGKYSFDKFGNLIPFKECYIHDTINKKNKISSKEIEIDVELNFSRLFTYLISAGLAMPSAVDDHFWNYENSRQAHYPFGYQFGISIKPNLSGFIQHFSVSLIGINSENKDKFKNLNSIGLFINHTFNLKKIYFIAGVGALNQTGALWNGNNSSGLDLSLKNELGYNMTKRISVYAQTIYTTTFLGYNEEHNHLNCGLKINF